MGHGAPAGGGAGEHGRAVEGCGGADGGGQPRNVGQAGAAQPGVPAGDPDRPVRSSDGGADHPTRTCCSASIRGSEDGSAIRSGNRTAPSTGQGRGGPLEVLVRDGTETARRRRSSSGSVSLGASAKRCSAIPSVYGGGTEWVACPCHAGPPHGRRRGRKCHGRVGTLGDPLRNDGWHIGL